MASAPALAQPRRGANGPASRNLVVDVPRSQQAVGACMGSPTWDQSHLAAESGPKTYGGPERNEVDTVVGGS